MNEEEYKKIVEKNMKLIIKELKTRKKTGIIKPLTGYEIISETS